MDSSFYCNCSNDKKLGNYVMRKVFNTEISTDKNGDINFIESRNKFCKTCKKDFNEEYIQLILNEQPPYKKRKVQTVAPGSKLSGTTRKKIVKLDRPEGGMEGVAWMADDEKYRAVSIFLEQRISAEERNQTKLNGPTRKIGMTPYKYFTEGSKKNREVVTDYFSDDDITVMAVV
jgi:hypothetical protein